MPSPLKVLQLGYRGLSLACPLVYPRSFPLAIKVSFPKLLTYAVDAWEH